jgi:hypothetical protein
MDFIILGPPVYPLSDNLVDRIIKFFRIKTIFIIVACISLIVLSFGLFFTVEVLYNSRQHRELPPNKRPIPFTFSTTTITTFVSLTSQATLSSKIVQYNYLVPFVNIFYLILQLCMRKRRFFSNERKAQKRVNDLHE